MPASYAQGTFAFSHCRTCYFFAFQRLTYKAIFGLTMGYFISYRIISYYVVTGQNLLDFCQLLT